MPVKLRNPKRVLVLAEAPTAKKIKISFKTGRQGEEGRDRRRERERERQTQADRK